MKYLTCICSLFLVAHMGLALADHDYTLLADVVVENPSNLAQNEVVVSFPVSALVVEPDNPRLNRIGVWEDGIPVPCSLTSSAAVEPTVLVLLDFEPGQSRHLQVGFSGDQFSVARLELQRTYAEISRKFGGHWDGREYIGGHFRNVIRTTTPPEHTDHSWFYRYEGPGWESDKVGYRIYLDWRNGIDIFAKKVNGMVLPQVGQDGFDSYHEESDWGMDILKVGDAMGIGGFGHWDGEKAVRVSDTSAMTCTIIRNDGLVSAFRNEYLDWNFGGDHTANLVADFEIEAGSYLTRMALKTDNDDVKLVTGLPKHEGVEVFRGTTSEGNVDIPNAGWSYLATYGDQSLDGARLGMAIFFQGGHFLSFEEDDLNYMVRLRQRGGAVRYSFGALWAVSAPEAADRESFEQYLRDTVERLNKSPRVTVNSAARYSLIQEHDPLKEPLFWGGNLGKSVVRRRGSSLAYGRDDPERGGSARWGYTTGLLSQAVYQLGEYVESDAMRQWGVDTVSSFINEDGTIATYRVDDYNIDQINSGKMVLELYAATGKERYRKAAELLVHQLENHPRTSGGAFWHKKIYPYQVWLDGVYMGAPFYARAGRIFKQDEFLDEVLEEFRIVRTTLRDPETGLYYHGWDESREQSWSDPETGLSDEFWGRGLGWYAMALVDCLDYYEKGSDGYAYLTDTLDELAKALVRWQDEDSGTWWQVLNKGGRTGNYLEASASSMFVYAMAKGINEGYLSDEYTYAVKRGWNGLVNEFIEVDANGMLSLRQICQVAGLGFGRDGTYDYYMTEPVVKNDPKGVGPFLMASVEVDKLLKN